MCPSCPQACIKPGVSDVYARPVASAMGSASMSARSAIVGADLGFEVAGIRATTPVPLSPGFSAPMPVIDFSPSASSSRTTTALVRRSVNMSSG